MNEKQRRDERECQATHEEDRSVIQAGSEGSVCACGGKARGSRAFLGLLPACEVCLKFILHINSVEKSLALSYRLCIPEPSTAPGTCTGATNNGSTLKNLAFTVDSFTKKIDFC